MLTVKRGEGCDVTMPARTIAAEALRRIVDGDNVAVDDASRTAALGLLLTRYSISAKHLAEPGPSDEEIEVMVLAALRAPDHNKFVPFRFVVARGEGLARLADLFVEYGRRRGKDGEALEAERQRAQQAPVVVAVIARITESDADVPVHEQWACIGGAIACVMNALHAMGYAGKMLSGARAADPTIVRAYCDQGERLVGWIAMGTPKTEPEHRGDVDAASLIRRF